MTLITILFLALMGCQDDMPEPKELPIQTTNAATPTADAATQAELEELRKQVADLATAKAPDTDTTEGLYLDDKGRLVCKADDATVKAGWKMFPLEPKAESEGLAWSKQGFEYIIVRGLKAGKETNGQLGRCVDAAGNVLTYEHIAYTSSTTPVVPVVPKHLKELAEKEEFVLASGITVECEDDTGGCVRKPDPKKEVVAYAYTSADGLKLEVPKDKLQEVYKK